MITAQNSQPLQLEGVNKKPAKVFDKTKKKSLGKLLMKGK